MRNPCADLGKPYIKPFISDSFEIELRRHQDSSATGVGQNPRLLDGIANRRRRDTADYLAARIDSNGAKRIENLPALGKTDGGAFAGGTKNGQAGATSIQAPARVGKKATVVDG